MEREVCRTISAKRAISYKTHLKIGTNVLQKQGHFDSCTYKTVCLIDWKGRACVLSELRGSPNCKDD